MTIERIYRIRCEMCNMRIGKESDELAVDRLVRQRGWRILRWDMYGNESHVCPTCADDIPDDDLKDKLLKRAEAIP